MDLSIITVSWNNKDYIKKNLTSLYKHTQDLEFEVFVSDNGSTDGTVEMVKKEFPQVQVIENKANIGFGSANNRGYTKAKGKYILFLNDDTEINSNIFKKLIDNYPQDAGMVGCKLLNIDGSLQDSIRRYPSLKDQLIILTKTHNFFPGLIKKYLAKDFDYNKQQECDQVMGAFMLSPKKVLDEVGVFDETFFNWYEEVDLQKRIKDAGYKIMYTPMAEITHVKGASFGKVMALKNQSVLNHSMRYYFRKHKPFWQYAILVLFNPLSMYLALLVQTIKSLGINVKKNKNL